MSRWIVIRKPCLPEDEGRYFFLKSFSTKEKAEAFIDKESEHDEGYFKKSDFLIQMIDEG